MLLKRKNTTTKVKFLNFTNSLKVQCIQEFLYSTALIKFQLHCLTLLGRTEL